MDYRLYKEGNYIFIVPTTGTSVYSGVESEVRIFPVDSDFTSFTFTGFTPTFTGPVALENLFEKNQRQYTKQKLIEFFTQTTGFKTATGGSVVTQADEGFGNVFLLMGA
jgi:hypothetical protein